jgi:hypothetical protein
MIADQRFSHVCVCRDGVLQSVLSVVYHERFWG